MGGDPKSTVLLGSILGPCFVCSSAGSCPVLLPTTPLTPPHHSHCLFPCFPADSIVIMSLRNLALISREETSFRRVLLKIVELFGSTRVIGQTSLLEHRGSLIIRHLCNLLSPEKVYCELSTILSSSGTRGGVNDGKEEGGEVEEEQDLEFCELMVQMLNLILLTANELEPMRTKLKGSLNRNGGGGGNSSNTLLFETIFNAWCHSPVSALSLCFLAQSYDLASVMISNFGDAEITVGLLMQVGKLTWNGVGFVVRQRGCVCSGSFSPPLLRFFCFALLCFFACWC